jgi:hypothetical protein
MVSKNFGQNKGSLYCLAFRSYVFHHTHFIWRLVQRDVATGSDCVTCLEFVNCDGMGWGGILVFLVIFLALRERRRSLTEIFSSVGLKTKGAVKSVFWSIVITPLFLVLIGVMAMMFNYFLGPMLTLVSDNGQIPL